MAVHERSAGFILYRVEPGDGPAAGRVRYLLLDYGRHWDFPKGHVEKGEDDLGAATRETDEETGITDLRVVPGFRHEIAYFFRHKAKGLIRKTVVFYLAEARAGQQVKLSHEHKGYAFEPFEPALRRVTYASAKQVLRAADAYLAAHPQEVAGGAG